MRMFRSLIFGGLAMLAAAMCLSAPAVAVEYVPPGYTADVMSFEFVLPAVFKADVTKVATLDQSRRSTNSHAVEYTVQNQPNSAFRQSVEALCPY